jgi:hypothetical protein
MQKYNAAQFHKLPPNAALAFLKSVRPFKVTPTEKQIQKLLSTYTPRKKGNTVNTRQSSRVSQLQQQQLKKKLQFEQSVKDVNGEAIGFPDLDGLWDTPREEPEIIVPDSEDEVYGSIEAQLEKLHPTSEELNNEPKRKRRRTSINARNIIQSATNQERIDVLMNKPIFRIEQVSYSCFFLFISPPLRLIYILIPLSSLINIH